MAEPRRIGPYALEGELARGGQGVVYRARGPQGPVALKLLLDPDPRAVRRFQQEGQVLLRTAHPNVLRGLDLGHAQGRAYLVSELIEGEDLAQRIGRSGPPAPDAARGWVRQIARPSATATTRGSCTATSSRRT